MAVAVQQRAFADRLERELELAGVRLARQEFLEQECVRGQAAALFPLQQRRDLVAEAEHATRLEPDHRSSFFNFVVQPREDLSEPAFGRVEHAVVIKRAPTTKIDIWNGDVESRVFEHLHCCDGGLRMEEIVKSIRPKNDALVW